jgi:hypothetical protein
MSDYQSDITLAAPVGIKDQGPENAEIEQIKHDWDKLREDQKKEFIEKHKTELTDDDLTVFSKPRVGCKHCYGRGFKGFYQHNQEIVLCQCLSNLITIHGKMPDTNNRMSYGQFKAMLAKARSVYNLKEPADESVNEVNSDALQGDNQEHDQELYCSGREQNC